ncbi:TERPENE CYCLASE/MUTASE FAMILY MEMBER [Salix koriyanagi]|uniref:TERPENE CYCLASE/MUTASE FAMILY MEMBER n=1 Tax=Salix koriyanagi TaxID=2511006 RepID=A0A9Q0Q940_9ROSI|nr:TERPENE CYCLASE/MUTASE FAMILY MEMBER [Salix koriyanagi]
MSGLDAIQCPQNFGSCHLHLPFIQEICCATVGSLTCLWHTCMGRSLLVQSHLSYYKLGKKSTMNLTRNSIGGVSAIYVQRSEDNYYPHTSIQILFWDAIYTFGEPLLTRWPFNKLREKALKKAMDQIHYEDESSRYITIGCIEKPLYMLACWVEDPHGDYFRRHLARIMDYVWIGEDGIKVKCGIPVLPFKL